MQSSKLLVSLCETDAEEFKFCIRNRKGSLSRKMYSFYDGGYLLSCGTLVEDGVYLLVDVPLEAFRPDIIYRHSHHSKDEDYDTFMFGYLVDDAPASVDI